MHRDAVELSTGDKLIAMVCKLKDPVIACEPNPKIASTAVILRVEFGK